MTRILVLLLLLTSLSGNWVLKHTVLAMQPIVGSLWVQQEAQRAVSPAFSDSLLANERRRSNFVVGPSSLILISVSSKLKCGILAGGSQHRAKYVLF